MRNRNAWIFLLATGVLSAQEKPADKLRIEKTQSIEFAAGGLLRLKNSTGALTIEAWDKPGVELTTLKAAKPMLDPRDREKAAGELEKVTFTAERHGNELEVTTASPRRLGHIDISYHLWVPRNTRLAIDHGAGEVNIEGVAASIEAALRKGEIFLYLPADFTYSTRALTNYGSINVPADSTLKPEHFHLGHSLVQEAAGKPDTLNLKVGFGDIYILQQTSIPKIVN
jgi:hypothetical protein